MRILQAIVFRLVFLAIAAVGVLLVFFELHELYDMAVQYLPDDELIRWGVAVGAVGFGTAGLVFSWRGRSRASRKIEFQSKHGYIVIELDSVEKSLQKAMSKLPELKDISLQVLPANNDRKVRIVADVVVIKPPGLGIRELASDLEDKLESSAKRMLGVDDVASVDLNIRKVLINVKKEFDATLDSNRLLEHQTAPAPAPASTAQPAAATPEPPPVAEPPKTEAGLEAPTVESGSSNGGTGDASNPESETSKGVWR